MASKSITLLIAIGILAVISISISWHLATTKYPTHSDVFWYGVIAGFLATLLLTCLALIGFLVYKLRKSENMAINQTRIAKVSESLNREKQGISFYGKSVEILHYIKNET